MTTVMSRVYGLESIHRVQGGDKKHDYHDVEANVEKQAYIIDNSVEIEVGTGTLGDDLDGEAHDHHSDRGHDADDYDEDVGDENDDDDDDSNVVGNRNTQNVQALNTNAPKPLNPKP